MTEQQYKDLLIATAKMSDYEHKDEVVEALKVASVSFQKEWAFTYHLPDHRQEYIIISVVPDKLIVLKEHEDFVDDLCKQVYEPNDYNEYSGLVLKPGILNIAPEEVSQEILFDDIQNRIIDEIREAKFSIWIAMAWFTNKKIFDELLKKRIVYMYEAGETKYLDVLLNSKSIVDFITRYYLIQEIAQYDRDFLNDIKKEKDEIEKIEESLKTSKGTLKEIKAEQKKLAISLENAKVVKSGYVNNLNEEEIKIQEEISIYQKELDLIELDVLMAALESNGSQYVGGTFAWPAPGYYTITSPYGMRLHPVIKSYRNHSGMDIGAPMGSYAIAANDGVVTKSMYSNSYGNMIMIDHGGGVTTLYAHGSELIARVGDKVKRGDAIMKVGSTGWSTGPHLHFEIRINGQTIDPYPYVTSNGNT